MTRFRISPRTCYVGNSCTNQSIFSQRSKLYFDRKCPSKSKAFQSWTWETILYRQCHGQKMLNNSKTCQRNRIYDVIKRNKLVISCLWWTKTPKLIWINRCIQSTCTYLHNTCRDVYLQFTSICLLQLSISSVVEF